MAVSGAAIQIFSSRVAGVEAHPHRFGGTEYRSATEIGHIHGDAWWTSLPDEGAR